MRRWNCFNPSLDSANAAAIIIALKWDRYESLSFDDVSPHGREFVQATSRCRGNGSRGNYHQRQSLFAKLRFSEIVWVLRVLIPTPNRSISPPRSKGQASSGDGGRAYVFWSSCIMCYEEGALSRLGQIIFDRLDYLVSTLLRLAS